MKIKYKQTQYTKRNLDVELINSIPLTRQRIILSEGDETFYLFRKLSTAKSILQVTVVFFLKEFIESYISKLEEAPIVGSAYGHTALNAWSERVIYDWKNIDDETI